jgi:hypothetical protein
VNRTSVLICAVARLRDYRITEDVELCTYLNSRLLKKNSQL